MAPARQQVCERALRCLSTVQAINEIKHVKNLLWSRMYHASNYNEKPAIQNSDSTKGEQLNNLLLL